MQPARSFTAWQEERARLGGRALADAALVAFSALCALAAAATIAAHPKTAIWDQARLLEARFEQPFHPSPSLGFTSQLLVIALRALLPAGAPLHEVLRIAAMLFWAGAATWLAHLCLERRALRAAFVALLFTSQYPFLWYSTELVAGGFLCLALAARLRGAAPGWLGALLALLALSKVELLLVALALAALWMHEARSRREALWLGGGFAGTLLLLVLPGFLLVGSGYWLGLGHADGGDKTFATFRQHFAALVAPFQIGPAPNPWTEEAVYFERAFPGARSFSDVLAAPGLPYLDFVALSAARGARKVGWVFSWAWLAVPPLAWAWRRGGLRAGPRERALLVCFVGCLPFVLLSYPHIRYFARYYPLFWILLGIAAERVAGLRDERLRRPALALAGLFALLALAKNAERAAIGLAAAPQLGQYWFPD
jgi:hypothetical protein